MRRALLAAIAAGISIATPVKASGLNVNLDEVRTITFAKPVATVYVGNPAIADITMIDARHAFVLGKGYGSTNIVALNADGAQISNTSVAVLANQRESTVTLDRGASRVTYTCTAQNCQATPEPGDGKDSFEAASGQMATHQDNAKHAASGQ